MSDIVLSVSGGGILGVGPAHFLARLEADLGRKLNSVFNAMGGTSTGAIVAAAVDEGIPATDIEELYKSEGRDIFKPYTYMEKLKALNKPLPKYNNANLRKILERMLKGTCSEWKKEIFIPAIDMISARNQEKVFDRGDEDIPKWFAVLASTSAPTYFMPAGADENWIDGGLVANNPVAIVAAGYRRKTGRNKFRVLHLETGMFRDNRGKGGNRNIVKWGAYVLGNFVARSETTNTYIARAIVGDDNVFVARPTVTKGYSMDDLDSVDEVVRIWDEYYDSVKDSLLAFVGK